MAVQSLGKEKKLEANRDQDGQLCCFRLPAALKSCEDMDKFTALLKQINLIGIKYNTSVGKN